MNMMKVFNKSVVNQFFHLSAVDTAIHRSIGGQNSSHQSLVQCIHFFNVAAAFATDSEKPFLCMAWFEQPQHEIDTIFKCPFPLLYRYLIEFQVKLAIDVDQGPLQLVGSNEIARRTG